MENKMIESVRRMNKRRAIDERYLRMAKIWSENSYALRRQVGCLIVKNNSVISDGYNGTPTGFPNICEYAQTDSGEPLEVSDIRDLYEYRPTTLATYPYVLHAESNAIAKLAKSSNSSEGATIYITDEPCIECSKMIIQSGIVRVVYDREYRRHDGIELLKRANIEVERIAISE